MSALAVHGVMTGVIDAEQRWRINHLDLVTPDGQPVRWALNLLHRSALPDQVHGAVLTAKLLPHLEDEAHRRLLVRHDARRRWRCCARSWRDGIPGS